VKREIPELNTCLTSHLIFHPTNLLIVLLGLLKQVDAGGDQIISGVNMNDDIYCLNMDANNQWSPSTLPWLSINGKLKYFSCGPYSCWGVNGADQIYILKVMSQC